MRLLKKRIMVKWLNQKKIHMAERLPYVDNLRVTLALPRATLDRGFGPDAGRLVRTQVQQRR